MNPTDQWKTICDMKQLAQTTKYRVHKHLPPTQILLIVKFRFRTPREVYPIQLVLQFQVARDIHEPPNKGTG